MNCCADATPRNTWRIYAALGAILVLAFFLRLYGLASEPVSLEAYSSVVHLDPPESYKASPDYERWRVSVQHEDANSLLAFLAQNRRFDPATMPLYYTLEYGWNKYIGHTPLSVRGVSMILGMLGILGVFGFARMLFGVRAGLLAALFMAFSPVHWHYSREIRMYVLLTLLAVVSSYTFLQFWNDRRKRWWFLHGLANLLLLWTHPFATLLPFVQGLYVLAFHGREFKRMILWGCLQVLVAMPPLFYILNIEFWPTDTAGFMTVPELPVFFSDLFSDDSVGLTYQSLPLTAGWHTLFSEETAAWLVSFWRVFGRVLLMVSIATAALFGACLLFGAKRGKIETSSEAIGAKRRGYAYLLLWWLVPPLVLYAASVFWRPCIHPRYTVHCSLALYALLGGALTAIPWRWPRRAAMAVFIALFAYEQSLVFGSVQSGADWKSASDVIRAEAAPCDLILHHDWYYSRAFIYNLGPTPNVTGCGITFDALAEEAAWFLDRKTSTPQGQPCAVWLVIRTFGFNTYPASTLETQLRARGLLFEGRRFCDMEGVRVYRVTLDPAVGHSIPSSLPLTPDAPREFTSLWVEFWRKPDYTLSLEAARHAAELNPEWSRAYSCMGMSLRELHRPDEALAAFQRAVAIDPSDYFWSFISIGQLLTDKGDYDGAIRAIFRGLDQDKNYAWGYTCLGRAYMLKGELDNAEKALNRAIALDQNDGRPGDLFEELKKLRENSSANASNPSPATDNTAPLPSQAIVTPSEYFDNAVKFIATGDDANAIAECEAALAIAPDNVQVLSLYAILEYLRGNTGEAQKVFERAQKLNATFSERFGAAFKALVSENNFAPLLNVLEKMQAQGETIPPGLLERLQKETTK